MTGLKEEEARERGERCAGERKGENPGWDAGCSGKGEAAFYGLPFTFRHKHAVCSLARLAENCSWVFKTPSLFGGKNCSFCFQFSGKPVFH